MTGFVAVTCLQLPSSQIIVKALKERGAEREKKGGRGGGGGGKGD